MAECDALIEWAQTSQEPHRPVGEAAFGKHLEYLAALPSKNIDEDLGRKSATVYYALLKDYPAEAIAHMVRRACETLDWFPTPRQCLELVATYRAPTTEQEQALLICREFAEEQFAQWLENVRNGQPIGDVPARWMRIAVERGLMRVLADGRFVSRALYHGPVRPVSAVVRVDLAA
ncbi:hypothetical protein [Sphingomonas sp. 10B4]|uniref:hypothetical protein n=1 Tax=Sphingomonas sp. 10B4 TaxID=3048575 RepID=UPI002AB3C363|nr:hypothetical protein [Sphingomonas sp. 10B4]MDY7525504.1 hypothetical protein [Sphingomonas sp. 10B4]MEB0281450.1 hypothetical protein [Sphingomonas sp. 10B4]